MAITAITGGIGTGKTLLGVYFALKDLDKGKKIFTNVKFRNIKASYAKKIKYLDKDLVNNMFQRIKDKKLDMTNSTVLIQEMHNYMDSRASMSKKNQTLSYWILQSRHTGEGSCDIIYDTQDIGQVDRRLRMNTDYHLMPQIIGWSDGKPNVMAYRGMMKLGHRWVNYKGLCVVSAVCELYNTHEVVMF